LARFSADALTAKAAGRMGDGRLNEALMSIRPIQALLAAFALVALAPPALAFTVENKDADGPYSVPKFNLEEQAKQFRKGDTNSLAPSLGKTDFSTPFGPGTLYFGTKPADSASPFSSFSGSTFGSSQNYRNHFERVVTPETLR
jgi:hypothetical protein